MFREYSGLRRKEKGPYFDRYPQYRRLRVGILLYIAGVETMMLFFIAMICPIELIAASPCLYMIAPPIFVAEAPCERAVAIAEGMLAVRMERERNVYKTARQSLCLVETEYASAVLQRQRVVK